MRNCDTCGAPIPQERLEALPDTTTCVHCSRETARLGFMISAFSKGTASEIVIVKQEDTEAVRRAKRANARSR
jgi:RNA polymerase-binding transcription factor DksA